MNESDVLARIQSGRTITGMSAVLLPFTPDGQIDWDATEAHIDRTVEVGLTPAVNMDTGYVQLLDADQKTDVLARAAIVARDDFVAGAYVADEPGAAFDLDGYLAACEAISTCGGTPVIFPSNGLNSLDDDGWVAALTAIGDRVDRFIGFELGEMFVPYGRIPSLDAYEAMMGIGSCIGAKHSSLSRQLEWDRLELRDRVHPDFQVLTGNDRHGNIRLRLSARVVDLRSSGVRTPRPTVGCRRSSFPRTQRLAAVPRQLHVPCTGARLPSQCGDVVRAARLVVIESHA